MRGSRISASTPTIRRWRRKSTSLSPNRRGRPPLSHDHVVSGVFVRRCGKEPHVSAPHFPDRLAVEVHARLNEVIVVRRGQILPDGFRKHTWACEGQYAIFRL